ncbi:hypothetical protein ACIQM0_37855 [Streptomyces sp. NPDC091387]|uniref:hypothetical protein n=1 Tax=Streptomyces sp. NPDC091387 TaxID=3365998 RepID=UPI0037F1DBB9
MVLIVTHAAYSACPCEVRAWSERRPERLGERAVSVDRVDDHVIGAGEVGSQIARAAVANGYDVVIAIHEDPRL